MSDVDGFIQAVISGAKDIAGQAVSDFLKEGTAESVAFRLAAKEDLQRWTLQLSKHEIDQDMFKDLVRGQWDAAVLAAIAKGGQTGAKAAKLRDDLLEMAIKTAFKLLL